MAYLLPLRLSAFALLGAALWSGCCANDQCAPDDPLADAVILRFAAGPNGFAVNDLDTLTVLRYPKTFTATTRPETVTLVRGAVPARGDSILINNNTPFSRTGNTTLGNYRYVVQYLTHPGGVTKPVAATAIILDSIRIQGRYNATGCCTNYTNTAKTVYYSKGGLTQAVDLKSQPYLVIPK
jgi:hypothetical protein